MKVRIVKGVEVPEILKGSVLVNDIEICEECGDIFFRRSLRQRVERINAYALHLMEQGETGRGLERCIAELKFALAVGYITEDKATAL